MLYNIHYDGYADRAAKVKAQEANHLRMLTDSFDAGVTNFANPSGVMVFTDTLDSPIVTPDWKAQYQAAVSAAAKADVLAKMAGLL